MEQQQGKPQEQVRGEETFEDYMRNARDAFVIAIKNEERSNYLLTAIDSFLICFDQMREKLTASIPTEVQSLNLLEKAHWHGWFVRERYNGPDRHGYDPILPANWSEMDYDEHEEWFFKKFKELYAPFLQGVQKEEVLTKIIRSINPEFDWGKTDMDVFRSLYMLFDPSPALRIIYAAMEEYAKKFTAASSAPPISHKEDEKLKQ